MNAAPIILPYQGKTPRIHRSAMISPGVTIIGDVEIGADSSVFYGCVLRGDVGAIRIGERTNVQDNSVMHVERGQECVLEDDVTIGHQALVLFGAQRFGLKYRQLVLLSQHFYRAWRQLVAAACRAVGLGKNADNLVLR